MVELKAPARYRTVSYRRRSGKGEAELTESSDVLWYRATGVTLFTEPWDKYRTSASVGNGGDLYGREEQVDIHSFKLSGHFTG